MLQPGGEIQSFALHTAAVALADGLSMAPITLTQGHFNKFIAQVKGITTATITWECTVDGTNWVGLLMRPTTSDTAALTATADGIYRGDVTGLFAVRARISAWTEGAITVTGVLTTV